MKYIKDRLRGSRIDEKITDSGETGLMKITDSVEEGLTQKSYCK